MAGGVAAAGDAAGAAAGGAAAAGGLSKGRFNCSGTGLVTPTGGAAAADQSTQSARADARYFSDLLPQYRRDPAQFRQRLLTETMERVLAGAQDKFFLPAHSGDAARELRHQNYANRPLRQRDEVVAGDEAARLLDAGGGVLDQPLAQWPLRGGDVDGCADHGLLLFGRGIVGRGRRVGAAGERTA